MAFLSIFAMVMDGTQRQPWPFLLVFPQKESARTESRFWLRSAAIFAAAARPQTLARLAGHRGLQCLTPFVARCRPQALKKHPGGSVNRWGNIATHVRHWAQAKAPRGTRLTPPRGTIQYGGGPLALPQALSWPRRS